MSLSHFMEVDSIIFDLDGTLWDSSEVVFKAWHKITSEAEEVRQPITKEMLQSFMGLQLKAIGEKFLNYLDEEKRMEIMKSCCKLENEMLAVEGGRLFPELKETLRTLNKKYPLFIVSNCESGYIEAFLDSHRLHKYFTDFECPGNTGLSKGDNIRLIMDRNNLEKPVYVGDTQGDCSAAETAGVPFVFASYGFGKVEKYDYVINTFGDIVKLSGIEK